MQTTQQSSNSPWVLFGLALASGGVFSALATIWVARMRDRNEDATRVYAHEDSTWLRMEALLVRYIARNHELETRLRSHGLPWNGPIPTEENGDA